MYFIGIRWSWDFECNENTCYHL